LKLIKLVTLKEDILLQRPVFPMIIGASLSTLTEQIARVRIIAVKAKNGILEEPIIGSGNLFARALFQYCVKLHTCETLFQMKSSILQRLTAFRH
jgi:hypothetical protein